MSSVEWIVDSGSHCHVTSNLELLQDFVIPADTQSRLLIAADGMTLPIVGQGSVKTERYEIPGVFFVPNLGVGVNIISVRQLVDNHCLQVAFMWDRCVFLDEKSGRTVGSGHKCNGRYILDYLSIGQDTDASLPPTGTCGDAQLEGAGSQPQPSIKESLCEAQSQQQLHQLHEASDQAKRAEAPEQPERDRFGLSRFNRSLDDGQGELPITVGMAYYACVSAPYNRDVFILDSGATHHMTPDSDLLDAGSYMESTNPMFRSSNIQRVHVGNGEYLEVSGIGNIKTRTVTLLDVLHVPRLPGNLVSVTQLSDQLTAELADRLRQDNSAHILQNTGLQQLQIDELARHVEVVILPQRKADEVAPVTIGKVEVGRSARVDRLYHLLDLQPCPPVKFSLQCVITRAQ